MVTQLRPKIILDERERGSIRDALSQLDCDLRIETLEFGDFIVSNRIGIERKRGDDLVASMFDTRLFGQLYRLKAVYPQPLMILENPRRMFERSFVQPQSVYGALVNVATRMGVRILPTENEQETADLVFRLAKNEQERGFIPENVPSSELDDKRGLISKADQLYFLEGLLDVGDTRARRLIEVFQTPQFALHAIEQAQIEFTKGGKPKAVNGLISNIENMGVKVVETNQRLLTSSFLQNRNEKKPVK